MCTHTHTRTNTRTCHLVSCKTRHLQRCYWKPPCLLGRKGSICSISFLLLTGQSLSPGGLTPPSFGLWHPAFQAGFKEAVPLWVGLLRLEVWSCCSSHFGERNGGCEEAETRQLVVSADKPLQWWPGLNGCKSTGSHCWGCSGWEAGPEVSTQETGGAP